MNPPTFDYHILGNTPSPSIPSPHNPGTSTQQVSKEQQQQSTPADGQAGTSDSQAQQPKARRAFKACAHCRSRKAKCDLGDLTSPHSPPCARCRREGVECNFLPSRRGGRVPFSHQKKAQDPEYQILFDQKPVASKGKANHRVEGEAERKRQRRDSEVRGRGSRSRSRREGNESDESYSSAAYSSGEDDEASPPNIGTAMGHVGSLASTTSAQQSDFRMPTSFSVATPSTSDLGKATLRYPPVVPVPPPISSADIFRYPRVGAGNADNSPASIGNGPSEASPAETQESEGRPTSDTSSLPNLKKKRRRSAGGLVDPETLASANLRNPVDALDLLALAADRGSTRDALAEKNDRNGKSSMNREGTSGDTHMQSPAGGSSSGGVRTETMGDNQRQTSETAAEKKVPSSTNFPLVKKGILSPRKLTELVHTFFSRMHFVFPICPFSRIPKTEAALAKFASEELHLTTTIIVIASRHDKNPRVHEKSWAYLQTLINDIILGKSVSVGAVEALLLLSEYLPRQTDIAAEKINAEENRMSWMLVGTAVRLGYMLGLDQKTLLPAKPLSISTNQTESEEILNRERVAWTYCYLFDRQISIRTGKAFWSRGPGLCFTAGAMGVHPTAAKNFPSLRFIPEVQDDFASLLQAYVELTQIMTSANDCLYPSRERTLALVKNGEYYKYIDSFQQALEAFRVTWEGKRWATYPLTECIWITFHYLRLYIYAFAFQAHVQRATDPTPADDEDPPEGRNAIFPAGLVASPDAKFILEAIDAAADLLRLVCERLHPGGALPFLPWRIFMFISYAGVFLLKAVYVEAVAALDRQTILRLIKRLIFVLACASTDEQHPGVRYARLLNGLMRAFSQGQESATVTRVHTPSRRNSFSGETQPSLDFNPMWLISNTGQDAAAAGTPVDTSLRANSTHLPPTFDYNISAGAASPSTSAFGATGHGAQSQSTASTPAFPMLPFTESQPFRQLATSLDENATADLLTFDFGLGGDTNFAPPQAGDAFSSFLIEDSALDFFQSFDATGGDWGGVNNGA